MDLSNRNATQRAMDWFKKKQADERGEQIPGLNAPPITGPTIGPYNPTTRDKIADFFLSEKPTGFGKKLAEGLIGSHGLGNTGPAAIDFVPGVGDVLQASEAQSPEELAMAAFPMMPGAKGAKTVASKTAALADDIPAFKMPEPSGPSSPVPGMSLANNPIASPSLVKQGDMEVWHASPHDYDTLPSTKYINTGERTQNEGQGIYTASSEGVADWYWKNLLSSKNIEDLEKGDPHARAAAYIRDYGNDIDKAKRAFFGNRENFKEGIKTYEEMLKDPNIDPYKKSLVEASLPKLRARIKDDEVIADLFNKGEAKPFENTNVKYKFKVDADPSEFINQNRGLIDKLGRPSQSSTMNKRLQDAGFIPREIEHPALNFDDPAWDIPARKEQVMQVPDQYSILYPDTTWEQVESLKTKPVYAREGLDIRPESVEQMHWLKDKNIPGTRYLDAFSAAQQQKGPKTFNYVIGDDERFKKILGKWKMSGLLDEEALGNAATA